MRKPYRQERNPKDGWIRFAISIVIFLGVSASVFAYNRYQQRLAEEAVWYDENAESSPETTSALSAEQVQSFQVTDLSTYEYYRQALNDWKEDPDGTVWYQDKHYRRNSYVKAILAMGIDRTDALTEEAVDDYYGTGNADAMFLIAQDTAHNQIRMLMLPRDAIAEMDLMDLEGNFAGTAIQNLTLAWSYGDGGKRSADNAVKTVSKMLCGLKIDHYAAANMTILSELNDAVDGVTVTIPNDELMKRVPEWTKGSVITLHGDEAETFLRYRDINMDNAANYRMQQHQAYIMGFYDAVRKKKSTDSNIITELYDLTEGNMITDMQKDALLKLGMDTVNTGSFGSEDILNLPGIALPADETWPWDRVFIDYSSTIPILLDLFFREIG